MSFQLNIWIFTNFLLKCWAMIANLATLFNYTVILLLVLLFVVANRDGHDLSHGTLYEPRFPPPPSQLVHSVYTTCHQAFSFSGGAPVQLGGQLALPCFLWQLTNLIKRQDEILPAQSLSSWLPEGVGKGWPSTQLDWSTIGAEGPHQYMVHGEWTSQPKRRVTGPCDTCAVPLMSHVKPHLKSCPSPLATAAFLLHSMGRVACGVLHFQKLN